MIRRIRLGHAPNCSSLGNVLNVLVLTQAAVGALWVAAESWAARRRRPEPDGGETRLVDDPPALVRTGPGTHDAGPVEAHVALTRACGLPCPACHVDPAAAGEHVPLDVVDARFAALAAQGVLRVAVGGGEALRHPDLPAIAERAAAHGLAIGLTTSGIGARPEALRGFQAVHVSLDGLGETFVASRGYDGAAAALAAVRAMADAGLRVGVNVVVDRLTLPGLEATVAAAEAAGARDVQLLRLKPTGRAAATYLDRRLSPAEARGVWPRLQALMAAHPALTVRLDCSMIPWLAAHDVDPARLDAFGFQGCFGSDSLVAVDVAGAAHPCSFVPDLPLDDRWRDGVTTGACATCAWRAVCRGGCHAVARFLGGDPFSPDPECPRIAS